METDTISAVAEQEPAVTKSATPGVIYLSSVPPYMRVSDVEYLLSEFGAIGRVYLRPEGKLPPGGKAYRAKDAWVEFENKKHARRCAELLNGQLIGGRAPRRWRDCIWNIRYLHRFTWKDLTGYKFIRELTAKKRIDDEVLTARRSTQNYIENIVMKRSSKAARKSPAAEAQLD